MADTSSKVILNFSDEEFIPCEDGIFLKRLSPFQDENFFDVVLELLKRAGYEGVCYIGHKRGEVLDEFINQYVWEKAVENSIENFIFWISGKDITISDHFVKEEILYIEKIKSYKKRKYMYFNSVSKEYDSLDDYSTLQALINVTVGKINERKENGN